MESMQGLCAIRGNLVYAPALGQLTTLSPGYIITRDGLVEGVLDRLPPHWGGEVVNYGDAVITPGFCDMHLHAPQFPMLGLGMDLQLLEWLQTYTFPTEARFADVEYAKIVYQRLAKELIRRGTTRICAFSSVHRPATHVLMTQLEKAGVTGYVGKVNMDRNGGDLLTEDTQASIRETRLFLEECSAYPHLKPILTPRFVPSCSDALLDALGKLAQEFPQVPVQSHLSENLDEIAWVRQLHPDCKQYWQAYDKFGLFQKGTLMAHCVYSDEQERKAIQSHLSENLDEIAWVRQLHPDCKQYWQAYDKFGLFQKGTLMAHCVYSDEQERKAIRDAGVVVVHCPDSNTSVASGIAPLRRMLDEGLNVVMGSDIAGGAKLSMPDVATEAIRVSKLRWLQSGKAEPFLTVREAFYLITTAGQAYFGAKPGFGIGESLHAVVFNDSRFAFNPTISLEERLERILYLGDKSNIVAVYSAGRLADI